MAVTKREIIQRIWKRLGGKQKMTQRIIQRFMDEIIDELAKGNRVEFRDFGTFRPVRKPSRMARNPLSGARVQVPPRTVVMFKAGRKMKKKAQAVKS